MGAKQNETVVYTVEEQARICAKWFQTMIDREYVQARERFEQEVRDGGYVTAYERCAARMLRAEMQKKMLEMISEACLGADPITALEATRRAFEESLRETIKRNDGTPEQMRVQALRAENQGWAITTIGAILLALRNPDSRRVTL